jgi:hypothetical protein
MLFSFLLLAGLIIAVTSVSAVPFLLGAPISPQTIAIAKGVLLWIAGVLSGLMMLISMGAAAWGMNTRLPWRIGVFMYLLPALSLPAFLLLRFSVRLLSRGLWALTLLNSFVWLFGDRADRIASGIKLLSDPLQIAGMFLNAFTLLYLIISVLVQIAALCEHKRESRLASKVE